MHFRKENVSLAVTEVPTPEQFLMVTREGAEQASQPLPGDGLPTAAQESSHTQPTTLVQAREGDMEISS